MKLKSLIHSFRLEQWTNADLDIYIREFITHMEDYGTEARLGILKPVLARTVCPHFRDTPQEYIESYLTISPDSHIHVSLPEDGDDDAADLEVFEAPGIEAQRLVENDPEVFEAVPLAQGQDDSKIDFSHSLETPPMHHINDTAAKGVPDHINN